MKTITKALAVIMLSVAVVCAAGCKKENIPNNGENGGNNVNDGGGSNPIAEGIYLGVIGFNYNLFPKEINLLNSSTKSSFTSFIDDLSMENLTGLYYADYTALKKLKSYGKPPKLTNVALVTFTDGLDNASLDDNERNPENYPTKEAYLNALHNKITTDKVHGLDINAYTIGLKGNDVQDVAAFHNNLEKLASDDNNVFEVASMDEAIQRFAEIAESLHTTNTTTSLSLLVPPGYDEGQVLRFTFDLVSSASNSSLYIECTYRRTNDGRRLDNISYHGFEQGLSTLPSVEKMNNGFYRFVFKNLKKDNGNFINEIDKNRLKLYRRISAGWEPETEFDNNNQSSVIEEQSSALIMLVLDCTTSLGNQFSSLKTGAKRFVETLVNTAGGNGGGGNSGGVVNAPEGAVNGLFSVSANNAVFFSKGNLQYQASTHTWRFAEHQYDYVGSANNNASSSYSGWIDLFAWGTSGYNHGAVCYQPWSTSQTNSDYYAYGSITKNLYDNSGKADWGYNAISNGGNQENLWRTLTMEEWQYLFNKRSPTGEPYYANLCFNGKIYLALLPDNWDFSSMNLNYGAGWAYGYVNHITLSDWNNNFEPKGVVLLPPAGGYYYSSSGNYVYEDIHWGNYYSSTVFFDSYDNNYYVFGIDYGEDSNAVNNSLYRRWDRNSVRLVQDY